jgi:hypothetical protein
MRIHRILLIHINLEEPIMRAAPKVLEPNPQQISTCPPANLQYTIRTYSISGNLHQQLTAPPLRQTRRRSRRSSAYSPADRSSLA